MIDHSVAAAHKERQNIIAEDEAHYEQMVYDAFRGVHEGTGVTVSITEGTVESAQVAAGRDFCTGAILRSQPRWFTSPDPFSAGAVIADPQTFNRYAYCRNNPDLS